MAGKGFAEKLEFFGQNMQNHLNAGSHNLMDHKPAYFSRSVFHGSLSMKSVTQLSDLANRLEIEALQQMNTTAMQLQAADEDEAFENSDLRMNFEVVNFNDTQKSIAADINS